MGRQIAALKDFKDSANRSSRVMIGLTVALVFLAVILVVLTVAIVWLTLRLE